MSSKAAFQALRPKLSARVLTVQGGLRCIKEPTKFKTQNQTQAQVQRLNSQLAWRLAQRTSPHQELGAFIYSVSHDLRAPLGHTAAYAGMMQSETAQKMGQSNRRHLDAIVRSAAQTGRMMDAILGLSRIRRSEMRHERVSLTRLVNKARVQLKAYGYRLFGAFQRLHRAGEFEGAGLGLAKVRRFIRCHGGRTCAEGVSAGATFYFSLPKSPMP